jgi:transcriptional regulator with XRE-family HTH domain
MLINIRVRCAELGFSQRSLARRAFVSESFLSEVICGRHKAGEGVRSRISEALHAPEDYLFSPVLRRFGRA